MKFISIDVGIKNLSFCLFSKRDDNDFDVIKWDNIDLSEQIENTCIQQDKNITCGKPLVCGKPAKFIKNSACYCLKHAKKHEFLLPIPEFKSSFLNKQKIQNLFDIADKYKINYEKPCKKPDLIHIINEFSNKNCFDIIVRSNACKVDLVTIGKNIQHKFDLLFEEHFSTLNLIIIENQIGPLANKMKTIQGMLSQYFIMKNNHIRIDFVNSSNKLKDYIVKEDKLDYKQRKQLGIKTCSEIIHSQSKYEQWESFFQKHTKKDDLADCFLQGKWYIKYKMDSFQQ